MDSKLGLPAVVLTALTLAAAVQASAATPSDSLFAPLEAQQAARLGSIAKLGATRSPADVLTLLHAGLADSAALSLVSVTGDPREVAAVRLRVALARQEFAVARPLVAAIAAQAAPTESERALRFVYLFAVDDMARVDSITRAHRSLMDPSVPVADVVAAGRLALALLQYDRADSCFNRAVERAAKLGSEHDRQAFAAAALRGLAQVRNQRREFDKAFELERRAMAIETGPELLGVLNETLVRMGRTDDAITAIEWGVRLNPYSDTHHYLLGNGYARKNYTELFAAYPSAFADSAGRQAIARADALLASGDRVGARRAYVQIHAQHAAWADASVHLASLDVEDGRYESARDLCFDALRRCPEYGRAHATLAKALEFQRFLVDVHRVAYEMRFAAAPMPEVPGIERFVVNWKSLSPRMQQRVAMSVAPWKQFVPVLVEGGSSFFIKPLYMLLSECPDMATLRDTRIDYDSRLWDDVRGAGGFHTVTGIEDVERIVFDEYNTVLHELTHQVHGVLTADQSREIQELYRKAKERDDKTKEGYLSRYAGGSVWEYFAEGANALESPKRDAYDTREVVLERLDTIDPDLKALVLRTMAITDVSASYPIAYTNAGNDRIEQGDVDSALGFFKKALARNPNEETALVANANALVIKGDRAGMRAAADRALKAHPTSGSAVTAAAASRWYGGVGLDSALALLQRSRRRVRAEDHYRVDNAIGGYAWTRGDASRAAVAYDSVIAYQSDNPEALWGKAAAQALSKNWDGAFATYDRAVRMRTGVVPLRCDYARDLIRAGKLTEARTQLDEAGLLDPQNPPAEALRGWWSLASGQADSAKFHAARALEWGPWCDLARIVLGQAEAKLGNGAAADAAWAPVRERIAKRAPPEYVYRKSLAQWVSVHELPALERQMLPARTTGAPSKPAAKPRP